MTDHKQFDVIIIGGSYSGLAAAMALGRALKKTLIIDNGKPCNATTPYSHNFLTQDGNTPAAITAIGRQQVQSYKTITFFNGFATEGRKTENGFEIQVSSGETFQGTKLIFATGIKDLTPSIEGFSACWGISALHCPYCHGYEVRNERTGILSNGEHGYELVRLISNWTTALTLFTNGKSTLTIEQKQQLDKNQIKIIETEIVKLEHRDGYVENIIFSDGRKSAVKAIYSSNSFTQHCSIPEFLGCALTDDGYFKVDAFQESTVHGIFACGDNSTKLRSVANAVAMGTVAGMMASKRLISEQF